MSQIRTETKDRIASIEIDRVEKKNALTADMYQAMADEGEKFRAQLSSAQAREATNAFFEKRKPDFSKF